MMFPHGMWEMVFVLGNIISASGWDKPTIGYSYYLHCCFGWQRWTIEAVNVARCTDCSCLIWLLVAIQLIMQASIGLGCLPFGSIHSFVGTAPFACSSGSTIQCPLHACGKLETGLSLGTASVHFNEFGHRHSNVPFLFHTKADCDCIASTL